MLKSTGIIAAALIWTSIQAQDKPAALDKTEGWITSPKQELSTNADGAIVVNGRAMLVSKDLIKIDPAKSYELSGMFKNGEGKPSMVCFGFSLFDKDKKPINYTAVGIVPGTDTELAADVSATDTVVKIKDGTKWKPLGHALVAFETDPSFSDLPNRKLSSLGIAKVEKNGENYEMTLKKPVGKAFPAGTKVREHIAGGYMYTGGFAANAPADWKNFTGTAGGSGKPGIPGNNAWWTGAEYARILILANWNAKETTQLLIKNVTLTEK